MFIPCFCAKDELKDVITWWVNFSCYQGWVQVEWSVNSQRAAKCRFSRETQLSSVQETRRKRLLLHFIAITVLFSKTNLYSSPNCIKMALSKTVISFILVFAAFNVTAFFPNIQDVLSQVLNILRAWMPSVVHLMEEIVIRIHKYCTESLLKDIKRGIAVLTDLVGSVVNLLQPAVSSLFEVVSDGLVALHNNGMGYTDEILQQVLGIDGKNTAEI